MHKNSVVILGSSSVSRSSTLYTLAYSISSKLAKSGKEIFSGGSSGVMEAVSRGAFEADDQKSGVIGSNDDAFFSKGSQYITPGLEHIVNTHRDRSNFIAENFNDFVVLSGGFGTLEELSSLMLYSSTHKRCRIFIYGDQWHSFISWVKGQMLEAGYISEDDMERIYFCGSQEELLRKIEEN